MELQYANVAETIDRPLPWQLRGLSYTASGYGSRIPSSRMVRLDGEKKFRRVYVRIYSNNGTAYVITKAGELIVR